VRRVACALAALVLLAPPFASGVEFDRGDLRFELTGHLRTLFTFGKDLDPERLFLEGSTRKRDSGLLLTRARIEGEAVWRDRVYAEIAYDNEVFTGSGLDGLQFQVAKAVGTRTWFSWDRTVSDHDDGYWRHLLYRAWVRVEGDRYEVTLGRQRIPLGRGRLWNPIDLFNPIFPLAVEADQRIGVDALRARFRAARGLWVEGIWSPQDDPDEHKRAVRVELSRTRIDAALTVGTFARDWVFGADFATNLRGAAVRGEGTFTNPRTGDRFWQVVVGADYTFSVGSGLYALIEHLYNENRIGAEFTFPIGVTVETGTALIAAAQISALDRITTISLHQTGIQVGYDLTPLLRFDFVSLYDWSGPSVVFAPALTWSATPNLDLSLAGQLFYGPEGRSDYGGEPPLLILRGDLYF
jgi:hypothetical protein